MRRRSKTKAAAVLVSGLTACNFDMGECYLRGQGTDGAGGSIIIPSAATGAHTETVTTWVAVPLSRWQGAPRSPGAANTLKHARSKDGLARA
jgi:hypothetical protein